MTSDLSRWIDRVTCADCLDVLRELPGGCVDCIITDPPYSTTLTNYSPDNPMVAKLSDHAWSDSNDWVNDAARVLAPHGSWYAWSNFSGLSDLYRRAESVGWRPFNLLVWVKTNPMPSVWHRTKYRNGVEVALYGAASKAKCYVKEGLTQQELLPWRMAPIVQGRERSSHPTQKPLAITMEWVIHSCPEGGTVLDPFLGSGTTAVACVETGRHFIGVELNPEYVAIAERRIEAARRAHQPALAIQEAAE